MKIAVLGAAGIQARGTVQDLLEFGSPERILLGDISATALDHRVAELTDDRVEPLVVDMRDHSALSRAIDGYDVVIMSGPSALSIGAMPVVREAGCHYVDLGASPANTLRQLEAHEAWAAAGLTAILGAGSAPGISNVMARLAVDRLDTVRDIDVYIAMRDLTHRNSILHWPFELDAILDEYSLPAVVVRDGQQTEIPPRTSTTIRFDPPIGEAHPVYTSHPETVTLHRSFLDKGCRNTTFSIALPEDFHRRISLLVELGFAETEPIPVAETEVAPRDVFLTLASRIEREVVEEQQYSVTRVLARGTRGGLTREVSTDLYVASHPRWNLPAGVVKTAIPPSIVAQMLARGDIDTPGVFAPETGIPPETFFTELARRAMEVTVTETPYAHRLT